MALAECFPAHNFREKMCVSQGFPVLLFFQCQYLRITPKSINLHMQQQFTHRTMGEDVQGLICVRCLMMQKTTLKRKPHAV